VLEDLGQVLKMNGTKRMSTVAGQEVRNIILKKGKVIPETGR
jgi:hypothetical protein